MNQVTVPASNRGPRVHDGPKVTGLAALITIVCFAAYMAVVWASGNIGGPMGGDDGYLRAVGFFGLLLVWLASIVAVTMRAGVSALWAIGGTMVGLLFTPIVLIAYLAIYVALGGEVFSD